MKKDKDLNSLYWWIKKKRLQRWIANMACVHHRIMASYLRSKGWVVFYLEEENRCCGNNADGCWLKMYKAECERRRILKTRGSNAPLGLNAREEKSKNGN